MCSFLYKREFYFVRPQEKHESSGSEKMTMRIHAQASCATVQLRASDEIGETWSTSGKMRSAYTVWSEIFKNVDQLA
jgi:hypothetical protein